MEFRIRASATYDICAGSVGLTETQQKLLTELHLKEKRTEKQEITYKELTAKKLNNQPTVGMVSYCKKWLKEAMFKRREQLNNKFINKGLYGEEDAFTLMALVLNLGMVYKNSERKKNQFAEGECDLYKNGIIYDNKCSYSLDTFPMYDDEAPDDKYIWQGQNYMWLWDAKEFHLVYTLIDCPFEVLEKELKYIENHNEKQKKAVGLLFTEESFVEAKSRFFSLAEPIEFVEIPKELRVKVFKVMRDEDKIKTIERRSKMCQEIVDKLIAKYHK